jgi:ribose 5-phosphate isomerase B
MSTRRIVIANDHGGTELKLHLVPALAELGWAVEDLGAAETRSVDYPDYALRLAQRVTGGEAQLGVLICGTGIGMCIVANKVRGIRAALCHDIYSARMARAHNDANVLCMGGRVVGPELGRAVALAFLEAEFEGGRHARRLERIAEIEGGDGHR